MSQTITFLSILKNPTLLNNIEANEQIHLELAKQFCEYILVDNLFNENFSVENKEIFTQLVEKLNLSSKFFILDELYENSKDPDECMKKVSWINSKVFIKKNLFSEVKEKWYVDMIQRRYNTRNKKTLCFK